MTVRWTVRADGDQGAQFAPRPSPVLSTRLERVMYRFGLVAQLVRALACHARGRGFEPHSGRQMCASVAQSVEQGTENPRVVGSIPTGGTTIKYISGFSSSGRAPPCQGGGSEFEPRNPLHFYIYGAIAKW